MKKRPQVLDDSQRCTAIKLNGDRCRAPKMRNRKVCKRHEKATTRRMNKTAQVALQSKWETLRELQYEAQAKLGLYALQDVPRIIAWWIDKLEDNPDLTECEVHKCRNMYLTTATKALGALQEAGRTLVLQWGTADRIMPPDGPRPEPPVRFSEQP